MYDVCIGITAGPFSAERTYWRGIRTVRRGMESRAGESAVGCARGWWKVVSTGHTVESTNEGQDSCVFKQYSKVSFFATRSKRQPLL